MHLRLPGGREAKGGPVPEDFEVKFTDTHALHGGGQTITAGPAGLRRIAHARPRTARDVEKTTPIDDATLRELVALLVEIQAWAIPPPSRPGVPDETARCVNVRIDRKIVTALRWANDTLPPDDPVGRIERFLRSKAPSA